VQSLRPPSLVTASSGKLDSIALSFIVSTDRIWNHLWCHSVGGTYSMPRKWKTWQSLPWAVQKFKSTIFPRSFSWVLLQIQNVIFLEACKKRWVGVEVRPFFTRHPNQTCFWSVQSQLTAQGKWQRHEIINTSHWNLISAKSRRSCMHTPHLSLPQGPHFNPICAREHILFLNSSTWISKSMHLSFHLLFNPLQLKRWTLCGVPNLWATYR
jgi:hypothetical protein